MILDITDETTHYVTHIITEYKGYYKLYITKLPMSGELNYDITVFVAVEGSPKPKGGKYFITTQGFVLS